MSIRTSISNNILRSVLLLLAVALTLVCVCAAPVCAEAVSVSDFSGLQSAVNKGGTTIITLTQDVAVTEMLVVTGDVTILGNEHHITRGSGYKDYLFSVGSGGKLTLGTDTSSNILTISGFGNKEESPKASASLIYIDGGTLVIHAGVTIRDNIAENCHGGGVNMSGGSMEMYGGTITCVNSSGTGYGGGVCVGGDGTFTMYGGSITAVGTNAHSGGGVFVINGRFILKDGEISNNYAYTSGGGVCTQSGTLSYFTMEGGLISNNQASWGGGGVRVAGGEFKMSGGVITGNRITGNGPDSGNGGGVDVTGMFTFTAGEISQNLANTKGGGVYLRSGTFEMSGGTFEGNKHAGYSEENAVYVGQLNSALLSGNAYFSDTQTFLINSRPSAGIGIADTFSGQIRSVDFVTEDLGGQVIFTIHDTDNDGTVNTDGILSRLGLKDSDKWELAFSTTNSAQIIATLHSPKVAENSVSIEWVNSEKAIVQFRIDPSSNDAHTVSVQIGSSSVTEKTGTFTKGSTVQMEVPVSGLTVNTAQTVTISLKHNDISKTGTATVETTTPNPSSLKITDAGGTALTAVSVMQGTSAAFDTHVYETVEGTEKLLEGEPVTWALTQNSAEVSGGVSEDGTLSNILSVGDYTLTATSEYGSVSASITIHVVGDTAAVTPDTLTITVSPSTSITEGETAYLTPVASVEEEQYAGLEVSWTVSGGTDSIIQSKTGEKVAFTPASPGTYTITATVGTVTQSVTLTVVGKPVISAITSGENTAIELSYQQDQSSVPSLTVTVTAPAETGTLAYWWERSTDQSFLSEVTKLGTDTDTLTIDTATLGTFYYRVSATYTENGYDTSATSDPVKVTITKKAPTSLTLKKDDAELSDGDSIVLYLGESYNSGTTIYATASNGESEDFAVNWVVTSSGSFVTMQVADEGASATFTPTAVGTSTVVVSAKDAMSVSKTITVDVRPIQYTVTIPPEITIPSGATASAGEISAALTQVPAGSSLSVSLDGTAAGEWKLEDADAGTAISYTLTYQQDGGAIQPCTAGGLTRILNTEATYDTLKETAVSSATTTLTFTLGEVLYSGTYTDTLTFSIDFAANNGI